MNFDSNLSALTTYTVNDCDVAQLLTLGGVTHTSMDHDGEVHIKFQECHPQTHLWYHWKQTKVHSGLCRHIDLTSINTAIKSHYRRNRFQPLYPYNMYSYWLRSAMLPSFSTWKWVIHTSMDHGGEARTKLRALSIKPSLVQILNQCIRSVTFLIIKNTSGMFTHLWPFYFDPAYVTPLNIAAKDIVEEVFDRDC
jgi:hypothetical protein